MKKDFLWLLLAIFPFITGCSNDENGNSEKGVDDLAYMLNLLAPTSDGKVYGVVIDERTPDIIGRPVKTVAEAQDEFYKLIPDGKDNKGLVKEEGGLLSYQLTDANGKKQGSINFAPGEFDSCGEVSLSSELKAATGYSRIRYIQEDMWPPRSGGLLEDLLNGLKK